MNTIEWIAVSEMVWGVPFLAAFLLPKRYDEHSFTLLKISLPIALVWVLFWLVQLGLWLSDHLCY